MRRKNIPDMEEDLCKGLEVGEGMLFMGNITYASMYEGGVMGNQSGLVGLS